MSQGACFRRPNTGTGAGEASMDPPLYAHGPISLALIDQLQQRAPRHWLSPARGSSRRRRPLWLDLQLALYVCYELHYRGFAHVDDRWEWDGGILHLRGQLERIFLSAVRRDVGSPMPVQAKSWPRCRSNLPKARPFVLPARTRNVGNKCGEYFVHRSLYHLKEGDPHAWAIPRLTGQAKASFVAVEFDEFGGGAGARVHQQLYADLLVAADLDPTYLAYLHCVPAVSLAPVNLMSMFGLHRALRGRRWGTSPRPRSRRHPDRRGLASALRRLRAPRACVAFYDEHVEADAVHEQVVRNDVVGDLVANAPHLEADVVFGIQAFQLVEDRPAAHLMKRWDAGHSSLRRPL